MHHNTRHLSQVAVHLEGTWTASRFHQQTQVRGTPQTQRLVPACSTKRRTLLETKTDCKVKKQTVTPMNRIANGWKVRNENLPSRPVLAEINTIVTGVHQEVVNPHDVIVWMVCILFNIFEPLQLCVGTIVYKPKEELPQGNLRR